MIKFFIFFSLVGWCSGAKILALWPFRGTSHFLFVEPLFDELSRRGHDVTVASYFPKTSPFPNYTAVSFVDPDDKTPLRGFFDFKRFDGVVASASENVNLVYNMMPEYEKLFDLPQFYNLQHNKYDLVLTELFNSEPVLGLVYKIGAPFVLMSTCDHFPWQSYLIGDSINPSYIPHTLSVHSNQMSLFERAINLYEVFSSLISYETKYLAYGQTLAEKRFGKLPPLREIANNASLFLVHTHFTIHGMRPMMPNSIPLAGITIKPPKPLPKDLQKIMDQSEGVIYFSMGSVLKGDSLHDKKQQAFIKVFSELKQTVLWKRESPLSENVKNIVTNGWYPQRDILAHPKIQLFITHCGLLGTNEAVSSGVPMVGIPMFGDQHHNAKALESIGVAVTLDFNELNENNIREAINKVLKNPSYKENAKKMKEAYLDRPMSPLDTAVYWVEYVIRHKGAPHLKSAARHLTWYQYHNLDVYALLLLIVYVSYLTVKFIIKFLCALCCKKTKVKTQ